MKEEQGRRAFLLAMLRMGQPKAVQCRFRMRGLTQGEYFMLDMLCDHRQRHPGHKGMYVSALAELLQVTPPAVSRMLRGLEQKGFVERVVDREDRRTTYIVLRPGGIAAQEEMERAALQFAGNIAERLGPEDTAAFIRLYERLNQVIQEELTEAMSKEDS